VLFAAVWAVQVVLEGRSVAIWRRGRLWGKCDRNFCQAWFWQPPLGGHTGDTYGAVVEWTEAFVAGTAALEGKCRVAMVLVKTLNPQFANNGGPGR